MGTPRVTVGIPVFNGEKWLADTVRSVLEQSLGDINVIISDNASTDGSWEIARALGKEDARINCYRNPENLGVFRNLDRVFELSTTPYFKWCSIGDRIERTFLERAVEILDHQKDVVLVYARTKFIGQLAEIPRIRDLDAFLNLEDPVARYRSYMSSDGLNSPFHGLIRSDALSQTGLNRRFQGSDQCMISALCLQGRFVRLEDELLVRRIDPETATATKTREELNDFFGNDAPLVNRYPVWKFERQLWRDVFRSPIKIWTKLRVVPILMRRLIWRLQDWLRGSPKD